MADRLIAEGVRIGAWHEMCRVWWERRSLFFLVFAGTLAGLFIAGWLA